MPGYAIYLHVGFTIFQRALFWVFDLQVIKPMPFSECCLINDDDVQHSETSTKREVEAFIGRIHCSSVISSIPLKSF